jgi:hypothetical protein
MPSRDRGRVRIHDQEAGSGAHVPHGEPAGLIPMPASD